MKFIVDNNQYFIKWNYTCEDKGRPCKVECIVYNNTTNKFDNPLLITTTTVGKSIKWDRNEYRKISLGRTLRQLFPDNKNARIIAWQEYFLESPKRKGKLVYHIQDLNRAYNTGRFESSFNSQTTQPTDEN